MIIYADRSGLDRAINSFTKSMMAFWCIANRVFTLSQIINHTDKAIPNVFSYTHMHISTMTHQLNKDPARLRRCIQYKINLHKPATDNNWTYPLVVTRKEATKQSTAHKVRTVPSLLALTWSGAHYPKLTIDIVIQFRARRLYSYYLCPTRVSGDPLPITPHSHTYIAPQLTEVHSG